MSEETLINRAVSKAQKEFDSNHKPSTDWLKFLPLILAVASGYGAYQVMTYRVDRLEQDFREYRADHKEAHKAIWQRLGGQND
jgi:hypothetical protein